MVKLQSENLNEWRIFRGQVLSHLQSQWIATDTLVVSFIYLYSSHEGNEWKAQIFAFMNIFDTNLKTFQALSLPEVFNVNPS